MRASKSASDPSTGVSIESVRVGFDGHFKVGCWTPISVNVKVDKACDVSWSIEVPDPYGNPTLFPGPETKFDDAGTQRLNTLFRTGRLQSNLRIHVSAGDIEVHRQLTIGGNEDSALRPALQQSVVLVVVVGKPAGLSKIPRLERPLQVVDITDTAYLPDTQAAYDGLDILVIQGNARFSSHQQRAIRDWVYSGGQIALAIGKDADAFRASPMYDWIGPIVPLRGTRTLRELSGLESFAKQVSPISVSRRRPVIAARIDTGGGESDAAGFNGMVLVNEGREPLAVRSACGFGRVTFICVDLDRPPLSNWKALPDVLHQFVLDDYPQQSDQNQQQGQQLSKSGVSDMSSQLLAAIEEFPQIARTSTWSVMLLMVVYLLVIGPVDYFLVHRLFRNPWLTWLSFPAIACIAAALAIWTARTANQSEVRLNQIDLVDIDASAGGQQYARSRSWLTVYSPQSQRNQATVVPRLMNANKPQSQPKTESIPANRSTADAPLLLSWAAAPESGFGGLYRSGGIEYGRPKYRYSRAGKGIDDLPMIMWSTVTLSASRVTETEPMIECKLTSRGYGLLSGTITHQLPGPLREWMLAYGPGVYFAENNPRTGEPAVIEPGAIWSPDSRFVRQQELRGYLTKTRLKQVQGDRSSSKELPEYRLAQTEYDPQSRDPDVILRMMTFYRRAGGKKYTRLTNDSERRLDFSGLLELDRAVLFARIDEPANELQWNKKPLKAARRSAFIRIVLPVEQLK